MTKKLLSNCLISTLALLMGTYASGQQAPRKPDEGTLRISADLVQVDVLVTDRAGKPVTGLRPEDFELYDNNKPQLINHFSFEQTLSTKVQSGGSDAGPLPKSVSSGELKRVLAFVIDTLHMKPANLYRTQKMLEDFIDKKMQPGDLALILPTAGGEGFYQQFTADQRILRQAANHLRPFFFTRDQLLINPQLSMTGQAQGPANSLPRPSRRGAPSLSTMDVSSQGDRVDPLEIPDVRATISALNNLIDYMGKLPGRKVAMFISEGVRLYHTETSTDFQETITRAARANIVFYTVDPAGLDPLDIEASDTVAIDSTIDFANDRRADYKEGLDSLNALALDTGGKFFRDNNDMKAGLNAMIEENSSYYLLGFQPDTSQWDGKFHKLRVAVKDRPDLVVSTRKGYLARSDVPRDKTQGDAKQAQLLETINSPLVKRDIHLQVTPSYKDDSNREPVVTWVFNIDPSQLRLNETEGRHKGRIELSATVFDSKARAIDAIDRSIELDLAPTAYEKMNREGLIQVRETHVKPGVYQVRAMVRDTVSGAIGTANNYVEVPDMKTGRLALSSILIQSSPQPKPGTDAGQGAALFQRRLARGSQFQFFLVIYNASQGAQLDMRVRIMLGAKALYTGQPRPIQILEGSSPPSRILTGGVMTAGQLAPDDYTLEVTVIDKLAKKGTRRTARQDVDFTVQ